MNDIDIIGRIKLNQQAQAIAPEQLTACFCPMLILQDGDKMRTSEQSALGRVLAISREAYSSAANGEPGVNHVALLDCLSAALSHVNDEKKPLSKCLRTLKSEIKRAGKPFYERIKPQLSAVVPVPEYDFCAALRHIPAIIYGNDRICSKLVSGESDKARSMADAMKSYPGFLYGEFDALSPQQFYELVFGYYPKLYDEPFMEEMAGLFQDQ